MKNKLCKFCGAEHGVLCPSVKAVEYFPNGKVKRVEFKCAGDIVPMPSSWPPIYTPTPLPPYPTTTWKSTAYVVGGDLHNKSGEVILRGYTN